MGDFNSHSNVWGCRDTDQKGRIVEDVINRNNLLLYNNKSYTYLHPGTGTYSAIDLTLADASIFLDYSWKVHDDTALSVGHRICRLHPLQRGKTPPMGPPVGRGWIPVRSEDGILVVECSGSQGLALPLYNTPLWPLLGPKTGGWKWPVPINRLVMTCPKAHTFLQTYCSYITC